MSGGTPEGPSGPAAAARAPRAGAAAPRVTIKEIARRAGVSKGAVSYALNGRPGVSATTRERVLQLAAELEWVPNSAARSLSDARTRVVGLVISRDPEALGTEPFFMRFLAGLEGVLGARGYALLLQVVPSPDVVVGTLRTWASERRVDGVLLLDLRVGDPCVALVERLGLPAVVVGPPSVAGPLACVWADDAAAVRDAVQHLAALGHRRLARVAGPRDLAHTVVRDAAFDAAAAEAGVAAVTVHSDYSGEEGARVTRALLGGEAPPTGLLYDNDLMAVAGLAALQEAGTPVPGGASLVANDDSALCRATHPRLTALGHDVGAYGARAGELLLRVVGGAAAEHVEESTPVLHVRGSSGPPPGAPTGHGGPTREGVRR